MRKQYGRRNNRGMATWLKVVLIAGVLCFLGMVGLGIMAFMGFKNLTDPSKAKDVAATFMTIEDPLPTNFSYVMGANMFDTPVVVINDTEDKAVFTFFGVPKGKDGKDVTAVQAIDEIEKGGAAPGAPGGSGTAGTKKLKVLKRADMEIGGQKVPYVLGHTEQGMKSGGSEDSCNTFFGAANTKSGKMIFLMAQQTDGNDKKPGDMTVEKVQKLTNSIKSF